MPRSKTAFFMAAILFYIVQNYIANRCCIFLNIYHNIKFQSFNNWCLCFSNLRNFYDHLVGIFDSRIYKCRSDVATVGTMFVKVSWMSYIVSKRRSGIYLFDIMNLVSWGKSVSSWSIRISILTLCHFVSLYLCCLHTH